MLPSCEGGVRLVTDLLSVEWASPSLGESRIGSRVEEMASSQKEEPDMPSLHGMRALPKDLEKLRSAKYWPAAFEGFSLYKPASIQTFRMRMSVPKPHYFF
jgi:hypothetical protein